MIHWDERELSLAALAGKTSILSVTKIDINRENGFRVMRVKGYACIEGITAGEGPLVFGCAAQCSTTNIDDAFDADPQSSIASANHDAKRAIWPLGMFPVVSPHEKVIEFDEVIRWSCPEGTGHFDFWIYNMDSGALTTGAQLHVFAKFFGVWLRD